MTTSARLRFTLAVLALAGLGAAARAGQPLAPDQVSALGLWFEASDLAADHAAGAPVRLWPDRSGHRYDAIYEERVPQANRVMGHHQPPVFRPAAVGGRPAVAFDASQRHTLILNRAGHVVGQNVSGFSAVFLVRPTLTYGPPPAPGVAWTKNRYLFLTHVSNYNSRMSVQIVEDTGEVKLFSRPVVAQARVTQNSSFADGERHALAGDAWHRLIVTLDYQAKVARIVMDGKVLERALPADSADVFENVPSAITGIGSTTLGDWLTFQLAEMVVYDKALGLEEIRGLDAYLCAKYDLQP